MSKSRAKYVASPSSSDKSECSVQVKKFSKPKGTSSKQDPVLYQEVDMSDFLSPYSKDIETFRQILNLPNPSDSMPRSSTTVWALNKVASQQEPSPWGPSAMPPLSPYLKDAFVKFEADFQASNLPEGKFINPQLPLQSGTKWDNLVLRTDYKISPKPSGAPICNVPLQVLKEFEYQARQNLCTVTFAATFAKTASVCNSIMGKYQNSIKSTAKKVKKQIQKGANPEKK